MRVFLSSLLVVVIAVTSSCIGDRHDQSRIKSIKPGLFQILANPHGGGANQLVINGKSYDDVLGLYPYYIEVTNLHSIVFVTRTGPGKGLFHLYNLHTKSDVPLAGATLADGKMFDLGTCIGTHPPTHPSYVTIENEGMSTVTLREHVDQTDTLYIIDAALPSLTIRTTKTK